VQSLIATAIAQGCRQAKACQIVGITAKTLQRWAVKPILGDQRQGPTTTPANKFTVEERAKVISVSTEKNFVNMSPHKIVPTLADRGEYIGSESSFYRILAEEKLLQHRGRAKPKQVARPIACETTKPNELFSWDITYLRSAIRGEFFYLYLFLDLFSRKIVGHEVHPNESMDLSSKLLQKICLVEGIESNQLRVHSDNGGPMKGATMLVTMQWLGVVPSFSRPSVSNDNPFSESLFKTLKYCPEYPTKPFENIEEARNWVDTFVKWYNTEHLHSGINFVTPDSKHKGEDAEILKKRNIIYLDAKKKNPNRWSGNTRDWSPIEIVKLNHLKKESESDIKIELSKSC
jgi:putative transposase